MTVEYDNEADMKAQLKASGANVHQVYDMIHCYRNAVWTANHQPTETCPQAWIDEAKEDAERLVRQLWIFINTDQLPPRKKW